MIRKTGNLLLSLFQQLQSRLDFDYCSKVKREVMYEVNKKRRLNKYSTILVVITDYKVRSMVHGVLWEVVMKEIIEQGKMK